MYMQCRAKQKLLDIKSNIIFTDLIHFLLIKDRMKYIFERM